MSSITIHLSGQDEPVKLYVQWMDENCVPHEIQLELSMRDRKTMELKLKHQPPGCSDVILLSREEGDRHD